MRRTITSEHARTHNPIAQTLWIGAGIALLLALGDVVLVVALASVAAGMTAARWIRRGAGHRVRSGDVALAAVSRLPTIHRESIRTPAHAPWHRHSAA